MPESDPQVQSSWLGVHTRPFAAGTLATLAAVAAIESFDAPVSTASADAGASHIEAAQRAIAPRTVMGDIQDVFNQTYQNASDGWTLHLTRTVLAPQHLEMDSTCPPPPAPGIKEVNDLPQNQTIVTCNGYGGVQTIVNQRDQTPGKVLHINYQSQLTKLGNLIAKSAGYKKTTHGRAGLIIATPTQATIYYSQPSSSRPAVDKIEKLTLSESGKTSTVYYP
jgi:hypothetical protein